MIGIFNEKLQEIPVLHIVDAEQKYNALPVVTYFHGFTSAKEHNLPIAYLLAEQGYRVILPDSILHGERANDVSNDERQLKFFDIVGQNIKDLAIIKQELDKKQLIKDNRFGLAGTSMGGITTAAALTQYDWITVSAVLMGSPKITEYAKLLVKQMEQLNHDIALGEEEINQIIASLEKIDLSKQVEKLAERPLFFWHGEKDPLVPFDHAYQFYEEVVSHYRNPESIRFVREVERGHKVSRFATLETVEWFKMQL